MDKFSQNWYGMDSFSTEDYNKNRIRDFVGCMVVSILFLIVIILMSFVLTTFGLK